MGRDVAEYNGIKYSLQPHGLRSKLWVAFAFFVVTFGGALAIMSPAEAAPGQCYVEQSPSPTPTPTVTPTSTVSPTPIYSQTPCPTPPTTVTTTITKQVTVYVDRTVIKTETMTITPSNSPSSAISSSSPLPSHTPDPPAMKLTSGGGSLVWWGVGTAGVLGLFLAGLGVMGIARGRRQQPRGRHAVDNSETTLIPVVPGAGRVRMIQSSGEEDDFNVDDYADGEYDLALGGHAGESYPDETIEMPAVDTDTKPMPPVE